MLNQENKDKLRILHLITVFSIGGATENTLLTVEGLVKKGYSVDILTGPNISSEGDMYEEAKNLKINVFTLGCLKRNINLISDIRSFFKIRKFIKEKGYNLVHTHSSKAGFIGRMAAKFAGVPIIIHTIHGLSFHPYQNNFINKFYISLEKIGAYFSDKIIAVTQKIIDISIINGIGCREKFKVVRSGFNLFYYDKSKFNPIEIRNRLGISPEQIVIGKIARFSELKGHYYLINVISEIVLKIPKIKIILVGSGELEKEIYDLIRQKELQEFVIFTGIINQNKIPEIISTFDILVHTSLLEGLARVIPQAFLLEKPVVSFDIDGVSEIVIDNVTGFTVPPKNLQILADRIIKLAKDKELRDKFGKNGLELVKKNWSQNKMVDEIEKIYIELLNKKISNA